jgi:plastocyanin
MNINPCLITVVAALALRPVAAGTIVGTIHAEGKPGTEPAGEDGKYADRKLKHAERIDYAELRDFVVYIEGKVGDLPSAPGPTKVVDTRRISQRGASFEPHVLPIVVGTTVEWPNNDDIYHNVFSMSEARQFDLQLYKGNPPDKKITFDKPGRVDVFCSIHANMHCIVLVLENPCFAVADSRGRFAITNVPPGTYTLKGWHERLPAQSKSITVPETGEVKVDFVLGVNNLPKY